MNYSQQQPNGAFTVADQTAFCKMNAGTRLIGAPDRPQDKLAQVSSLQRRAICNSVRREQTALLLHDCGYSVFTVNRNRVKKHNG